MTRGRIIEIILTSVALSVLIQFLLTTVFEFGVRPDIEILNTGGMSTFLVLIMVTLLTLSLVIRVEKEQLL